MSVSLYQTGVSGLLSAQQQLATTGHNIANVNTEGYSRQRVEQNASWGIVDGNHVVGSGTYVDDITRIYDQFSYREQLITQSGSSGANELHQSLNQLNEIMSFSGEAMISSVESFYQSINSIADNPSDLGLRSIALSQAEIISSDFRRLNENFNQLEASINTEINEMVSQVSEIGVELAKINEMLLHRSDLTHVGQSNDLLDTRDRLVHQLAKLTNVNTLEDQYGVMTVTIGQGTTLVAGVTPLSVSVAGGDPDPLQTELRLQLPNSSVELDATKLGGAISAKFEFRDQHLKQVRNDIDRLAMSVSDTLNTSQANGLDLNGQQGNNLFSDINSLAAQQARVLDFSSNAGTLQAQLTISDVSLLPAHEFSIEFDGTDYLMTNLKDQSIINLGADGAGTYTTPFGFEFIEASGTPATGDKFLLRPNENAAANIQVELTDGATIAASTAVEITPSSNNISAGKVAISDMLDPITARAKAQQTPAMSFEVIEFPAGTFTYTYTDVDGTATGNYTPPAQAISIPPTGHPMAATPYFNVEVSGMPSGLAPNAPEVFSISDAFGLGNGDNALAMALTQQQGLVEGGTKTFTQSLASTTAVVGSNTRSAEMVADTAEALFTQAYNRNQSTSGVNLDEEAANLMRFQQAYQAASQIISVANTLFDTLLSVAR